LSDISSNRLDQVKIAPHPESSIGMDPVWSNLSSGTLPGAWSSTWTLSEGASNWTEKPQETSNFPKRFRSNKSLQDERNANLALRDISSSKWCIVSHSADPNIRSEDSDFYFSDEDSESGLSDDFYSIISQEVGLTDFMPHGEMLICGLLGS